MFQLEIEKKLGLHLVYMQEALREQGQLNSSFSDKTELEKIPKEQKWVSSIRFLTHTERSANT